MIPLLKFAIDAYCHSDRQDLALIDRPAIARPGASRTRAARSAGWTVLNRPRRRPSAVRPIATMYASGISRKLLFDCGHTAQISLRKRRPAPRQNRLHRSTRKNSRAPPRAALAMSAQLLGTVAA